MDDPYHYAHWLWAGMIALLSWLGKEMHKRITHLEHNKADAAMVHERLTSITTQLNRIEDRSTARHDANTVRLDNIIDTLDHDSK